MPQNVSFPGVEPRWIFDRDCVQFYALAGDEVLKCFISAEALMSHFSARGFSAEDCLRAFSEHREVIESAARRKILQGHYTRGDEVLLRTADFPRTTTTTTPAPRPGHGLRIRVDQAVHDDPALLSGVVEANFVLEQELAAGSSLRANAAWEAVRVAGGAPLAKLALSDDETHSAVNALFSAGDLANLDYARFSLFRLWDDLLKERMRKQLQALDAPVAGGAR